MARAPFDLVHDDDEVEAPFTGLSAIRAGLHAAGVATPGMVITDLIPSVRALLGA
jgi:hypothetical protein